MRKLPFGAALLALVCTATMAEKQRVMVLAGGHLSICSSMNLDACADDRRESLQTQWRQSEALFDLQYDPARLSDVSPALRRLLPPNRFEIIQTAVAKLPARRQSWPEIERALQAAGVILSEDEARWLEERLDLQALMLDSKTPRQEQLDVAATDPGVRAVFERFLVASQAGQQRKPRIGVLTSAAREPLDAAKFYQQWFSALGADVVWIPLDSASRTLRDQSQSFDSLTQTCGNLLQERLKQFGLDTFARADAALWQQYCKGDNLLPLLNTLDGVFFNGGDQSLHVRALVQANGQDSPELALIRKRFELGELAIMGTSAGTAVQSGNAQSTLPMISNGDTAHALKFAALTAIPRLPFCESRGDCPAVSDEQLSYRAQGGLRLFRHGILDTHFSERARQGRLLMLLADTRQAAGFGVDETTALVVTEVGSKTHLEVVGNGGVWIAQGQTSKRIDGQLSSQVTASYLRSGDNATLKADSVAVSFGECARARQYKLPALDGKRLSQQNGVNEAALQLQMLRTDELSIAADNSAWLFGRGKAFALCLKSSGWSYRDLTIKVDSKHR